MTQKELIKAVNSRLKELVAAEKAGVKFDKIVLHSLQAFLKPLHKKTLNFRGLTVEQRQLVREAGERFIKAKGSTLAGSIDSYNKKRENFQMRMRATKAWEEYFEKGLTFDMIEEVFRDLKYNGAFELEGASPSDDYIIQLAYQSFNNLRSDSGAVMADIGDIGRDAVELWKKIEKIEDSAYEDLVKLYYSKKREVSI